VEDWGGAGCRGAARSLYPAAAHRRSDGLAAADDATRRSARAARAAGGSARGASAAGGSAAGGPASICLRLPNEMQQRRREAALAAELTLGRSGCIIYRR
jgi:hypothetical protein